MEQTTSTHQSEAQGQPLVISHQLDAPRDLVFEVWTRKEHLCHWWGPQGFHLETPRLELEPGGTFLYSMQAGDGPKMWGKFVYREIQPPHRLVYLNSFSDEDANITRAPFSKTWPQEMLNVLTLSEENGKTDLVLTSWAFRATEEEVKTFEDNFAAMQQGFKGTFDKLKTYLAHLTA